MDNNFQSSSGFGKSLLGEQEFPPKKVSLRKLSPLWTKDEEEPIVVTEVAQPGPPREQ